MPKLITHGATMCCTLGATPAKLLVTSQSFRKISGAPVATENDKTGMINIPSFGTCIYNHRTTKTNQKYPSVNL